MPEKNELILKALINKAPMRRICEIADIQPAVLYNRLGFFRKQCERFARAQECSLNRCREIEQLSLSVDHQDYLVNWGSQFNRRNTQLSAIATADNKSGYVFGMHLDYDSEVDPFEADLHAREIGDYDKLAPYRHYARIWMPGDVEKLTPAELPAETPLRLSANGVRVRNEYTMFAHFFFIKRLLAEVGQIQFSLDPDPNIHAACLTAFRDRVLEGSVDAFYVRLNKDLTIDEKRLALANRAQALNKLRRNKNETNWQLAQRVMAGDYRGVLESQPKPLKRWIKHWLPHMGEPEKAVCYITDKGDKTANDVSSMMLKASLHGIDRYFMQLRRRISLLERPVLTASASRRVWHGTNPYNPQVVEHLLAIFRVLHNFTFLRADKCTAAMRIGLAARAFTLAEVLTYDETD